MDYHERRILVVHSDQEFSTRLVKMLRAREYEAYGPSRLDEFPIVEDRGIVVLAEFGCLSAEAIPRKIRETANLAALGTGETPEGFHRAIPSADDVEAIADYLDEIQARGRRRHVRFGSSQAAVAIFDFNHGEKHHAGVIHDISAAGMSCTFRPEPQRIPQRSIDNLHLNLPGRSLAVTGHFVSSRPVGDKKSHVFLFSREMLGETRSRIHDFIYLSLEAMVLSPPGFADRETGGTQG